MKARFYFSLSLLIMLAAYGCGGSSEIERKQAQKALEQARKLHADDFAPTDFQKAQVAFDHAQAAEKEGKTDGAKVLFTSAKIFFGKAADIAKAKQDSLSRELDSMQEWREMADAERMVDGPRATETAIGPGSGSAGDLLAERRHMGGGSRGRRFGRGFSQSARFGATVGLLVLAEWERHQAGDHRRPGGDEAGRNRRGAVDVGRRP